MSFGTQSALQPPETLREVRGAIDYSTPAFAVAFMFPTIICLISLSTVSRAYHGSV